IPLAVYWGFAENMQTKGLWYAISVADITLFIFETAILWKTDWNVQIKEIKKRVAEEQGGEELMELRLESSSSSLSDSELKAALKKRRVSPVPMNKIEELNLDKKEL